MILICGLPGSGNHMLRELVRAAGGKPLIWHGDSELYKEFEGDIETPLLGPPPTRIFTHAIMPVRNNWMRSRERALGSTWWERHGHKSQDSFVAALRETVISFIATRAIPLKVVAYEHIVANPKLGGRILAWADLPYADWPEPVVDGDAKYLEGLGDGVESDGNEERAHEQGDQNQEEHTADAFKGRDELTQPGVQLHLVEGLHA